jgi:ferredoxin-NADP reductase
VNALFVRREPIATNIYTFWFAPENRARYEAGQFTELYLPHDDPDERGIRRWFTLSSSPSEDLLAITVKFNAAGSSFKKQLLNLQPGTPVKLADAMGDFVLPKDASIPLVFIASGIGVTPMRSMVRWLSDKQEHRDLQLLYAASDTDELAFLPLLRAYDMPLTTIIKRPAASYNGLTGELSAERILQLADHNDRTLFYLSGPEIVVEMLTKDLMTLGIHPHHIITDYFHGYKQI